MHRSTFLNMHRMKCKCLHSCVSKIEYNLIMYLLDIMVCSRETATIFFFFSAKCFFFLYFNLIKFWISMSYSYQSLLINRDQLSSRNFFLISFIQWYKRPYAVLFKLLCWMVGRAAQFASHPNSIILLYWIACQFNPVSFYRRIKCTRNTYTFNLISYFLSHSLSYKQIDRLTCDIHIYI